MNNTHNTVLNCRFSTVKQEKCNYIWCHRQVFHKYVNWARFRFGTVSGGKVEATRLAHFQFQQLLTVSAWASAARAPFGYRTTVTAVRSCVGVGSSEPVRTVVAAAAAVGVCVGVSSEPSLVRPLRKFMVWKTDQSRRRLVSLHYI